MGCKGGIVVLLGIEASGCAELIPHSRNNVSPITGQFPVVVVLYLLTLTPIPWTVLDLIVTLSHSHTHTQIKVGRPLHCTALLGGNTPAAGRGCLLLHSLLTTHYSLPVVTTSKPSLPSPTSRYRSSTCSACCAAKPLPNTDGYLYGAGLGNVHT